MDTEEEAPEDRVESSSDEDGRFTVDALQIDEEDFDVMLSDYSRPSSWADEMEEYDREEHTVAALGLVDDVDDESNVDAEGEHVNLQYDFELGDSWHITDDPHSPPPAGTDRSAHGCGDDSFPLPDTSEHVNLESGLKPDSPPRPRGDVQYEDEFTGVFMKIRVPRPTESTAARSVSDVIHTVLAAEVVDASSRQIDGSQVSAVASGSTQEDAPSNALTTSFTSEPIHDKEAESKETEVRSFGKMLVPQEDLSNPSGRESRT